jgi:putative transposase
MCYMDKTPFLRAVGLMESKWDQRTRIFKIISDSGSEFGQSPFGGAAFAQAVRKLTGSFMTTTAGLPDLRGVVERLFRTFDLQWARKAPGYTASNPTKLNDRKPYAEACMTDDELHEQLMTFISFYNVREHRGIGRFTPAGMWDKLSNDPLCDPTDIPGPEALREACGVEHVATVSEDGIKFKGIRYSNEFLRQQRRAIGVDRIDQNGGKVEIKFDPMDLGAISLRVNDRFVTIPAVDQNMRGVRLCDWKEAEELRRSEARQDVLDKAPARAEAKAHFQDNLNIIKAAAGVDTSGASIAMISRAAMELSFGKGHHEKPFVGRDEYNDPVHSGFALSGEEEWQPPAEQRDDDASPQGEPSTAEPVVDPNEVQPDGPNAMDRFRSQVKPRSKR